MSNNVKYKNTHPVWTALGIIFLILILCAGVTALVGWLGFGWFTNDTEDEVLEDDFESGSRDGDDIQSGIVMSTYSIDPEDYDEYGVNPLAESAYVLKAEITGEKIYDIRVDWKLYWDESYTGNDNVTEYVTINDYSNASQEVVLSCLQPFGYNIYVEAYRTAYPDTNAVCKLDYVAKASTVVSAEFNKGNQTIDLTHNDTYGVGTITGSCSFSNYYFSVDQTTLANLDIVLQEAFVGSQIDYFITTYGYPYASYNVSFSDWLSFVTIGRGDFAESDYLISYSTTSLDYEDFIFYLADCLSSFSLDSVSTYITIDGASISSTDLVDVLWKADWNFYIYGELLYSTSVSSSSQTFETNCTFEGSQLELLDDGATLIVDQDNIIFGI